MYKLDLKVVNQINTIADSRLNDFARNLAAIKIQAAFRAKKCRMSYAVLRFSRKRVANKIGAAYKMKHDAIRLGAVVRIQRMFRAKQQRQNHLNDLKTKQDERNMQEKAKVEADNLRRKKAQSAIKIWKAWKYYKQWHGVLKATVSSYKQISAEKVEQELNKTFEIHVLKNPTLCGRCKQQQAERFCTDCQQTDNQLFCIKCYQEFHVKGARKKHNRKQIVYKN